MKIPLKWLTPILLRLLSLSHVTLANDAAAALQKAGSVHLVAGFHVGLAANPQPHDLSLDATTYLQLTNQEFALPIMPLHLLGKKSWNVYNQDNIAKVKRDEAAAAAKEAAEEERMQEIDSERRIQILRGEQPRALAIEGPPSPRAHDPGSRPSAEASIAGRERKKRKRPNEDDTDFELRVARDQTRSSGAPPEPSSSSSSSRRHAPSDAPLTDPSGHISLFPPTAPPTAPAAKNPKAERDATRERKDPADAYTLRFSHAAGSKRGLETPWYSKADGGPAVPGGRGPAEGGSARGDGGLDMPGRDVWGNEDPRRAQREAARVAAGDPLAAMRRGAAGVRRAEREKKRWREERDREVVELLTAERETEERRKRRRREDDCVAKEAEEGRLEGFSLDKHEGSASSRNQRHSEERRSVHRDPNRRSHHRDRDRSRDRDSDRHRRHHRH